MFGTRNHFAKSGDPMFGTTSLHEKGNPFNSKLIDGFEMPVLFIPAVSLPIFTTNRPQTATRSPEQ